MNSFLVAAVLFCNTHAGGTKEAQSCIYDLGTCAAKFEREIEYFKKENKYAKTREQSFRAEAQAGCFLFYKAKK